jgi:hypothetical protein
MKQVLTGKDMRWESMHLPTVGWHMEEIQVQKKSCPFFLSRDLLSRRIQSKNKMVNWRVNKEKRRIGFALKYKESSSIKNDEVGRRSFGMKLDDKFRVKDPDSRWGQSSDGHMKVHCYSGIQVIKISCESIGGHLVSLFFNWINDGTVMD